MRPLAAAVVAALALAPSAFAHAVVAPQVAVAGRAVALELTVPTESPTAPTVAVRVLPVAGLIFHGTTAWRGRARGAVRLRFEVTATRSGDYALRLVQRYGDGEVVHWSGARSSDTPAPVLHVRGRSNNRRDRVIIVAVLAAVAVGTVSLRRLRNR